MADLNRLIAKYDCFAWVPTIRGALSLDLIDNSRNLLGDVDKYSVAIKNYDGLSTEHYIAATSLLTVNDRKSGKDICRTFRYFFTGSIHNSATNSAFLKSYGLEDDKALADYLDNNGALIGRVIVVAEISDTLRDSEITFLKEMKSLSAMSRQYRESFAIDADSLEALAASRKDMVKKWRHVDQLVSNIEHDDKNQRPTYTFDVFLTRDGILLLKNKTNATDNNSFAEPGTADDYKRNVPIHRIFKCAMNYVKYLFHSNYHHNRDHDTYLPASNLYPAKLDNGSVDLTGVFRHQMDAFLFPIIKLKRNGFKDYTINGSGVILYARAFVKVCADNQLVPSNVTDKADTFLDIQEDEIDHMTQQRRSMLNTILSQRNFVFITTGILAFTVALLKIITTFIKVKASAWEEISYDSSFIHALVLISILLTGYMLYEISHSVILRRQFKRDKKRRHWLMRDSSLKYQRLSYPYQLLKVSQYLQLHMRQKGTQLMQGVLIAIGIIAVVGMLIWVIS